MARNKKRKVVQHVHVPTPRRPPTLLEYRGHRATLLAKLGGTLIKAAVIAFLGYCGMESIRALAGQDTAANIVVRVLGNLKVNQWAAWLFAGGGIAYGLRQQQLRRNVNASLGTRNSELEQEIDRRRTSSRLTRSGQTDPKDTL